MTPSQLRQAAYAAAVRAAIEAAPPIGLAEGERLARVWRVSGSELIFETAPRVEGLAA
jgi:uncharacterized protein YggE